MKNLPVFLFPGQGAQALGMAVDLAGGFPEAAALFDRGREVLGFDILAVCRDGPEAELNSTRVSQPAIFLHSMAVLEVLGRSLGGDSARPFAGDVPAGAAAGLSLGEYSALVFAGVLEFDDALHLVVRRGEFMQEACDSRPGAMASVMGLDASAVERVVQAARSEGHVVGIANYNSPEQTVISGAAEAVAVTTKKLQEAGARRAVPLRVAGAYHSPLMAVATKKMTPLLGSVRLASPRIPFFSNFFGRRIDDPEQIRAGLIQQIENSVRWVQCVKGMESLGLHRGLEVGPGRVLKGLLRKIAPSIDVEPVGTAEELDAAKATVLQSEEEVA